MSAPSGAGKTSLVSAAVQRLENLVVSVSHTTRQCRAGEHGGVDYHFIDEGLFRQMIDDDSFLEHAEVFNYRYGTSRDWVAKQLAAGADVILEIDWQGAEQVRQKMPGAVGIFVVPPSIDELRIRLEGRAQDDDETIERRMTAAIDEMKHYDEYAYLIVNDDFERATTDMCAVVQATRLRTHVQQLNLKTQLANLVSS